MPIVTVCQGCGQRLSVPDEFAGSTARCPQCKRVYTVPPATPTSSPFTPTQDLWVLRTEDGKVYGPVSKAELDRWVSEGRATSGSQVKHEGAEDWQPASKVYPQLQPAASNPFAERQPAFAPYRAPTSAGVVTPGRFSQPHRGGLILAIGIISVACCQLLSPVAWIMGQTDLKQIDAGVMDPEGRTLTQVGMVLGIIGTVLLVLGFVVQVLAVMAHIA